MIMFSKNPFKHNKIAGDKNLEEGIKKLIYYAGLAPSTHNSQPWLFHCEGQKCLLFLDPAKRLKEADPIERNGYISLGCCAENFIIAANYYGRSTEIKYQEKENGKIAIEFILKPKTCEKNEPENELGEMFQAIEKRINARGIFHTALPSNILNEFAKLNNFPALRINFIDNKEKIKKLAKLTAQGMRMAHANKQFRLEMSKWLNNNLSRKPTGMPGYSLKMPFLASFIFPALVKHIDMSWLLGKLNYKSVSSAPGVVVISSPDSHPKVWIEVGRLAERIMLKTCALEYNTSIYAAAIEMNRLEEKVKEIIGISEHPHFLICIGKIRGKHRNSPRLSVEDIII